MDATTEPSASKSAVAESAGPVRGGAPAGPSRPLGIIVNPVSGRDVRRLAARAGTSTPEDKRNQIQRVIVGAAAAGAEKVVLVSDPFRIADAAVEILGVSIEVELLDLGTSCRPRDTPAAVDAMRDSTCPDPTRATQ